MDFHVLIKLICFLTILNIETNAKRESGVFYDIAVQQFFGKLPEGAPMEMIKNGRKVENNVKVVRDCMPFIREYLLPNETIFAQISNQWTLRNSFFDVDIQFYYDTIENSSIGQYPNASNICHIFLFAPLPGWMNHQFKWMGRRDLKTMEKLFIVGKYEGMSRLVHSKLVALKNEDKKTFNRASRKVRKLCSAAFKYSLNETNFEKFEKTRRLGFENAAFEFLEEVRNDLLARNENTRVAIQVCRLLHQMNLPLERNSTREVRKNKENYRR